MSSSSVTCPRCGSSYSATAAKGLCPRCLIAALTGGDDTGRQDMPEDSGTIGPYQLLERLGEGGMGTVWRARQIEPVERVVALKVIKLGMDTNEVIRRFQIERQALALMDHANIARVLEAGATSEGRPYFVMEWVDGLPLTRYCELKGLPMRERLDLFSTVCLAVQHAHQKGVIHRDLKPSNILVAEGPDGPILKIIDFGIAKATRSSDFDQTFRTLVGQVVGTPGYMSPEQANASDDLDTRTDIYSLGALLYELLAGTPPFGVETFLKAGSAEIQRVLREEDPQVPSKRRTSLMTRASTPKTMAKGKIARDLDWIVMKALSRDRDRRYATASAMAEDLRRFLDHEPVSAGPPTLRYRAEKFIRKHRLLVAFATGTGLALLVGLLMTKRAERAAVEAAGREKQAKQEVLSTLADSYRDTGLEKSLSRNDGVAALWFNRALGLTDHDPARAEANRLRARLHTMRAPIPVRFLRREPRATLLLFDSRSRFLLESEFQSPQVIFNLETTGLVPFGFELRAACFIPGTTLAAVSLGNDSVELRDLDSLETEDSFRVPDEPVTALWASADGDLILAGTSNPRVWSRKSRNFVTGPLIHPEAIRYATFDASGSLVLTIDRVWNLRVFRVSPHSGNAVFGPREQRGVADFDMFLPRFRGDLVSVRDGDELHWIRPESGEVVERWNHAGHALDIDDALHAFIRFDSVRQAPAGSQLIGRSLDTGRFLPDHSGIYTSGFGGFLEMDGTPRSKIAMRDFRTGLSPDGTLLAVRREPGILIYQLARPEPFTRVAAAEAGNIALSSDGTLFASAGWNGAQHAPSVTRAFRIADGLPAGPPIETGSEHLSGAFLPDSTTFVSGGRTNPSHLNANDHYVGGPGVLQSWDVLTGKRIAGPLELSAEPLVIAPHPFEPWLAVLCSDGAVLRVDPGLEGVTQIGSTGVRERTHAGDVPLAGLVFSDDGGTIFVNGLDARISALDPPQSAEPFAGQVRDGWWGGLEQSGRLLLSPTNLREDHWLFDSRTRKPLPLAYDLKPWVPEGAHLTRNGRTAILSAPLEVFVFDPETGTPRGPRLYLDNTRYAHSVMVPGTSWVLTAAGSELDPSNLRLWDSRTGAELSPRWKLPGPKLASFIVTRDGRHALLSIRGHGYVIVDLDALKRAALPEDTLSRSDQRLLAEIQAGHSITDGVVAPIKDGVVWAAMWDDFHDRHPELPPLRPDREERLRWHRNQEALFGPGSLPGRWHRDRIEALGSD
ncbi:MAG: protein kinase [Akkermansiaceae bacterium]|nr:protein kinase [Akkermansiaceae bacterium]